MIVESIPPESAMATGKCSLCKTRRSTARRKTAAHCSVMRSRGLAGSRDAWFVRRVDHAGLRRWTERYACARRNLPDGGEARAIERREPEHATLPECNVIPVGRKLRVMEKRLHFGCGCPGAPTSERCIIKRFDTKRIPEEMALPRAVVADDNRVVAVNDARRKRHHPKDRAPAALRLRSLPRRGIEAKRRLPAHHSCKSRR